MGKDKNSNYTWTPNLSVNWIGWSRRIIFKIAARQFVKL